MARRWRIGDLGSAESTPTNSQQAGDQRRPSPPNEDRERFQLNAELVDNTENDMNMQALVDGLSEQWKRERAETQMTLGKLIAALEGMPDGAKVANLRNAHSYRGYYSDLAFELAQGAQGMQGTRAAAELLTECRNAMGRVFHGYKGGDYVMGETTPVWVAPYGGYGYKLMAVYADGVLAMAPDEF